MPRKDLESRREYDRQRHRKYDATRKRGAWKAAQREYHTAWWATLKMETMSHYGLNGTLQCSWPECEITDIDMMNLDHIYNNGQEDRVKGYNGARLWMSLRRRGWPDGYQTLCANHNLKKELMRRRS